MTLTPQQSLASEHGPELRPLGLRSGSHDSSLWATASAGPSGKCTAPCEIVGQGKARHTALGVFETFSPAMQGCTRNNEAKNPRSGRTTNARPPAEESPDRRCRHLR